MIGESLGNTAIDLRFGKGIKYPRPSYRVVEYGKDNRECYSRFVDVRLSALADVCRVCAASFHWSMVFL